MAEMRNVCNYNGMVVSLTENEWYELNRLFCSSGRFGGESFPTLDKVIQTVFELGLESLRDEVDTHQTLAELTGQWME